MKRTEYHRQYYERTKERRRQYARDYKARRYWLPWLLQELGVTRDTTKHGTRSESGSGLQA